MSECEYAKFQQQLVVFWKYFFTEPNLFQGHLVSAQCFFHRVLAGEPVLQVLVECDVRQMYPFSSDFPYRSTQGLRVVNRYSRDNVQVHDHYLSARFHALTAQITHDYRGSFIDQLRCTHFLGMAGNETLLLYPSQHRRLQQERITGIAGEIRTIQTGFGDFRFNAPTPANLPSLLALYANRIETLLTQVDEDSIYDLVSFAQYYFALLHPFYERCGRTSEELMYLLFTRIGFGWRYICANGDRSSALANERMYLLNHNVEDFNRRIALCFALPTENIQKTPDIYRLLTATYCADQYQAAYATEGIRPFYYSHPVTGIMAAYYFLMEALLLDEIMNFHLEEPYPHIRQLGRHLREAGAKEYSGTPLPSGSLDNLQRILASLADRPHAEEQYAHG